MRRHLKSACRKKKSKNESEKPIRCLELCKEFPDLWKYHLGFVKDLELDIKFKPDFTLIFYKPIPIIHSIKNDFNTAKDEIVSQRVCTPIQFMTGSSLPIKKGFVMTAALP
ncbi:hypothetical protein RF11_09051 [Thelohanellus kitauei]|uniref:Uncharacterized protein n=1 Tax=Thelohanellus kitauei TaxID=669202 RepID=A0A0C2MTR9_THEKT|nr:hypothetical protein RF11_09051 [Thelohanellus kitauei]